MVRARRGGDVAIDSTPAPSEADILLPAALSANPTQIRVNYAELDRGAWVRGFQRA